MRMKRPARLQAARSWVQSYQGKNLVRGYRKRFAVDFPTAINELRLLGIKIDPAYEKNLNASLAGERKAKAAKLEQQLERDELARASYQDSNFAFIVGYTSMGFPYGVTWEEMDEDPFEDSGESEPWEFPWLPRFKY
jgi:hypothetical protein